MAQTAINETHVISSIDFVDMLRSDDEVIAGSIGFCAYKWIFVSRRGRKAYMTFCDDRTIHLVYHSIIGKYKMKAFDDCVKESVVESSSQRLISANQEQFITEFDNTIINGCLKIQSVIWWLFNLI
ncbi:hypothetical protein F9L16_04465 [Agarivorans sp. B2Z047]|uniref:hypothetical protein n=1 Tax=Agarivorans sp. B2Z047 TaxID=2652721 RepID=UPI00128BB31A|nr:hypothetical protein [Agarivorans sp. B2Z047]MPW28252.1 hypothetical protein [Agarivorans sp. B2Z047]UQN43920.1 hypothetical protein LQZ07_05480 [Agarivorans sp. B2Z047]